MIYIEMEHEDSGSRDQEEILTVCALNAQLKSSYDRLYWLVNEDATRDAFFSTLNTAMGACPVVDLYIVAHGGMQYFWGHFNDRVYVDDILGLGSFPGMNRLCFVYIGSCHSWDLTDEFLESGADCAIGSDSTMDNFPFLFLFADAFARLGYSVEDAYRRSIPLYGLFRINGDRGLTMEPENVTALLVRANVNLARSKPSEARAITRPSRETSTG
ncbi:MAG TPA: hypothetical protein PKM41_07795 [Deltaproteobacteria bacterium]|nr:hypothetical protein [Deltaproteobacteria bacterium]HOI07122.1 hypothetical protein [Deltaproteobacteria bacterium]